MTIDNAHQHYMQSVGETDLWAAERMGDILSTQVPTYNPLDPHMEDTPERFVKMLRTLTTPEPFSWTTFETDSDEMVISYNIPFYTFCAHHVLPFFGEAHVAYIPNGKLIGISKLARCVEYYCKGLNVQEELTRAIADKLQLELDAVGVAVVMNAEHLCMTMRGVEKPGARTSTSAMLGAFADHTKMARSEFLSLIRSHGA